MNLWTHSTTKDMWSIKRNDYIFIKKKNMKKILRLTEGELNKIVRNSIYKLLSEDVLGDNWHEKQDDVLNNYEAFKTQEDETEHNWSGQGEEDVEPMHYNQDGNVLGWNDDEAEGYEEDVDWYRDDVNPMNDDLSDGDLYRGMW